MNLQAEFTLDGWGALIASLRARGYAFRAFADVSPEARHVILRHDVDFSLDDAVELATAEEALGVSAHYFVLVRTEFYNVRSAAGQAALRRLAELGHRVGLHLDAALYDNDRGAVDRGGAEECRMLEAILGRAVDTVSFHRPAPGLFGDPDRVAGRAHTYMPRYVKDIGYVSDSRGAWHHGHPLQHAAVASGHAFQLLTHPIWWTGAPTSPDERVRRFLARRAAQLETEAAAHCTVFRPAKGSS